MPRGGAALSLRRTSLRMSRAVALESRPLAMSLVEHPTAILYRSAELLFGTLNARLNSLRPVAASRAEIRGARARRRLRAFRLHIPPRADRMKRRARRRRDTNAVRIVLEAAFDPITGGEEGVEALDEVRVASE
jgi:hypothetical protein